MSETGIQNLPDFLIIGAMKSGTSSLHYYLNQHPDLVSPTTRKEIHFFDNENNFRQGKAGYRSHFLDKKAISQKAFESTPLYIFNPLVPGRIADMIPGVKLIAVLRDPVERAISHYFHEQRKGRETLPIMEALLAEEERLKPYWERKEFGNMFPHYSYKSRGHYHEQLERYLTYFQARNILVIASEVLFAEPSDTLKRVFDFVGVNSEHQISDVSPRNVGSNRTEVDARVYDYLREYFRPHNQALHNLTGQDFGWS